MKPMSDEVRRYRRLAGQPLPQPPKSHHFQRQIQRSARALSYQLAHFVAVTSNDPHYVRSWRSYAEAYGKRFGGNEEKIDTEEGAEAAERLVRAAQPVMNYVDRFRNDGQHRNVRRACRQVKSAHNDLVEALEAFRTHLRRQKVLTHLGRRPRVRGISEMVQQPMFDTLEDVSDS